MRPRYSVDLTWLLPMSWHAGIGLSHKLFGRHLTDETPIKLFPFVHSNWTLSLRPCLLDGVALRPSVSSISGQLTYRKYKSVFIYRYWKWVLKLNRYFFFLQGVLEVCTLFLGRNKHRVTVRDYYISVPYLQLTLLWDRK